MKYLISGILLILFFFFFISKMYLYSFIQLVVFISYIFYISKDKKEDDTIFDSVKLDPLPNEKGESFDGYVYTINMTSSLQENIKKAVEYDNTNSLIEREFGGLSDEEILRFENNELKRFYQYDDDFGIRDYKFGQIDKEKGLSILAKTNDDYVIIGYLNYNDAMSLEKNKDKFDSHRLVYQGGKYKHITVNSFSQKQLQIIEEEYILKLIVYLKK